MVREGFADRTEDTTRFTVDRRQPHVLRTETLAGARVRNSAGEDLGRIEDLAIDLPTGQLVYAVVSFGGFFGMGGKYFAVPWSALRPDENGRQFVLDVDRKTLEAAPGFDTKDSPEMAPEPFGAMLHRHSGRTPYWAHDVTDAGDYVGDNHQTNRGIEYDRVTGYHAGGR